MFQWTVSLLVQLNVLLFSTNLLPYPMMTCKLDQTSGIFYQQMHSEISFAICRPFRSGLKKNADIHRRRFKINLTQVHLFIQELEKKAMAGYNSQQIPNNNNIQRMLIVIISLR